jgi:Zn ribbon nucleic-acid-binding protein
MLDRLLQVFCKHQDIIRVRDNRLFLECLRCGHESKGITAAVNPYRKGIECLER